MTDLSRIAELEARLENLERENAELRSAPTMIPPASETPTRGGLLREVLEALTTSNESSAILASNVETLGRVVCETRKTVIEDLPLIVQTAVANATIELATKMSQLRAEHDELKSQVQACEGCPRRKLAGVA